MVIFLFAVLLIFSLFTFGNPQWNRWIYVWQVYYWPKWVMLRGEVPEIEYPVLPDRHTGILRHWSKDGRLELEWTYKNGWLNKSTLWGGLNGTKWHETNWRRGKLHGKETEWDYQGNITSVKYYWNGKEITKEEYFAACAKDPTLPKPPEEIKQDSKPAPP